MRCKHCGQPVADDKLKKTPAGEIVAGKCDACGKVTLSPLFAD